MLYGSGDRNCVVHNEVRQTCGRGGSCGDCDGECGCVRHRGGGCLGLAGGCADSGPARSERV
ncbi:MAG TPA: hypothetical protein DCL63_01565 [Firmicutes bacterium]|nr:hypothetical protein [Bacillota bacterium]HBK61662.1 hypothetical protein [Bacillota bacterium]